MPQLTEEQALLRVDRFGLTSNNVTYGVAGDLLGYWGFFPATEGWGRIPVWGFADVVATRAGGVEIGARVFGFLPMATHLVVEPARIGASGFADAAAHRSGLPGVYNRYQRTGSDPLYAVNTEALQAVLLPLFVTSFVLDDFLADNDDFGAAQLVLSSASSKTAAGTALCVASRDGDRPSVVGLTSPEHAAFVASLGCYDRVLTYDDLTALDPSTPTVFVDIAGNANVRETVHRRFGPACVTAARSGWPTGTRRRQRSSHQVRNRRCSSHRARSTNECRNGGWPATSSASPPRGTQCSPSAKNWVDVVEIEGIDALQETYQRLLGGLTRPQDAFVATPDRTVS